jgi:hypothetical protein
VSWYLRKLRRHESDYARTMQLHEILDKLDREVEILFTMDDSGRTDDVHLGLMVDQAKRVRRTSTMLVKALASERDNNATAQEAQANE